MLPLAGFLGLKVSPPFKAILSSHLFTQELRIAFTAATLLFDFTEIQLPWIQLFAVGFNHLPLASIICHWLLSFAVGFSQRKDNQLLPWALAQFCFSLKKHNLYRMLG